MEPRRGCAQYSYGYGGDARATQSHRSPRNDPAAPPAGRSKKPKSRYKHPLGWNTDIEKGLHRALKVYQGLRLALEAHQVIQ